MKHGDGIPKFKQPLAKKCTSRNEKGREVLTRIIYINKNIGNLYARIGTKEEKKDIYVK